MENIKICYAGSRYYGSTMSQVYYHGEERKIFTRKLNGKESVGQYITVNRDGVTYSNAMLTDEFIGKKQLEFWNMEHRVALEQKKLKNMKVDTSIELLIDEVKARSSTLSTPARKKLIAYIIAELMI